MKTIELGQTGIRISQLAFGTASIHHLGDPKERTALLHAALNAGFTHFDTSPFYGFGVGETALASIASSPKITICTKVGLYPPGGADQSRGAILARKIAGKIVPSFSRPLADLSVALAKKSLADSRRRLGRHRIDLLMLHEPDYATFQSDEWQRFIESEADGIGALGVAGEAVKLLPFAQAAHPFVKIVQTRDSQVKQEAQAIRALGRAPDISYGQLAAMAPGDSAVATLSRAIAQYPNEAILVSTRKIDRVASLAAAAS